ncbi:epidermis-specific secreted glycoprotein EP1-like [Papaver somniferum]|nr:epidermis-specific secreted glycoprotein EP1-like [Papaver somniferum]
MIKSYSSSFFQSLTVFLIVCCSSLVAEVSADVPASKRFSYDLQPNSFRPGSETEYRVSFRDLPIQSYPFSLCFYEANPESTGVDESVPVTNSYILAIGMGHAHPDGITRWVWAANLNRPVGNKAKLIFSRSGNLALIDGNGRIGWQTRTSNKGVVDIRLLPNGNLVLLDRNGGFVWQSFHYPTNTLLVGQGLGPGSSTTNKIVNGRYSLVLQDAKLSLFIAPEPKSSKPTNIYNITQMSVLGSNITFDTSKHFYGPGPGGFYIQLSIVVSSNSFYPLASPKYNSTLSMLRIGSNGNLFIYTYFELPSNGYKAWEKTYATFSGEGRDNECILPSKCGSFGLCEDGQCVACPTPKGQLGWDKNCKLPSIPSCNASAANVGYYEVPYVADYRLLDDSDGEGSLRVDECMKKCSSDCKCVGFFHRLLATRFQCLLATQINTLAKGDVRASADVYIKYTK